MDFKCWCCAAEAVFVCDCPQDSRSCENHYMDHKMKNKSCQSEYVKEDAIDIHNAIKSAELELAKISQDMVIEINNCFKQSLDYLHSKKDEARGFIYRKMKDEADAIKNWARALNLKERDKNQYIFSMKKVLSVDASSDIAIDVEKSKRDFEENEKKYRELQCQMNEENEKKLEQAYKKNKELQCQIDEENEKKLTVEKFMSKINKGRYEGLGIEGIKYNMLELNFEGFKETFINKSWNFIVQIDLTENQKYIFVCKFLSRL
ncbi:hypothetical protein SteCoe_33954 [Stentor coeruleus]|uniref:Uncharacterized protein n=1 Tax=Stentor coeruleus TaxID=5963 RepID=A0A1R2AMJ4_9CILI|nr:hypothetical protein SteCoe_37700 [Stentor coeruleus]OMJ68563.1 hypothetical protein SteCoe_33954 [Stentor coeruleus]